MRDRKNKFQDVSQPFTHTRIPWPQRQAGRLSFFLHSMLWLVSAQRGRPLPPSGGGFSNYNCGPPAGVRVHHHRHMAGPPPSRASQLGEWQTANCWGGGEEIKIKIWKTTRAEQTNHLAIWFGGEGRDDGRGVEGEKRREEVWGGREHQPSSAEVIARHLCRFQPLVRTIFIWIKNTSLHRGEPGPRKRTPPESRRMPFLSHFRNIAD
jgi:hypothetical protein